MAPPTDLKAISEKLERLQTKLKKDSESNRVQRKSIDMEKSRVSKQDKDIETQLTELSKEEKDHERQETELLKKRKHLETQRTELLEKQRGVKQDHEQVIRRDNELTQAEERLARTEKTLEQAVEALNKVVSTDFSEAHAPKLIPYTGAKKTPIPTDHQIRSGDCTSLHAEYKCIVRSDKDKDWYLIWCPECGATGSYNSNLQFSYFNIRARATHMNKQHEAPEKRWEQIWEMGAQRKLNEAEMKEIREWRVTVEESVYEADPGE